MAEKNAEQIYTCVLMNLTRRHADLRTFRRLAEIGVPAAASTLQKENLALANAILNDPAYDEFFTDRKAAVEFFGGADAMATITTKKELLKYSRIVDAAVS